MAKEKTKAEMQAEIEEMKAKLAAAQKASKSGLTMKVSQKGAVSLYGMSRFPVTLYRNQWEKVLDMADDIRAFIDANADQLKMKDKK